MPSALRTLLRLHFRGTLRRMLRGVRTPRGLVFLILGIFVLCAWLIPSSIMAVTRAREDPQVVRTIAPFAILAFCLGNVFASFGEKAIAFTGAEVDFLFPGPFTRRSLLGYKIVKTALGTFITTFFFSIWFLRYTQLWIACFVGLWLTIQFMQLFAIAVMMIGQTLGERLYSVGKRGLLIVVLALAAIAIAPKIAAGFRDGPQEFMRQVHATAAGRVLLAPFDVFVHAITARTVWPELISWGSLALLIDVAMLGIVIGLDANYLETSAIVSQRRYERSQRMRRSGIGGISDERGIRFRIPMLPWLGGAGPIAWRQLTGAIRSSRSLLIILVIVAIIAGSAIMRTRGNVESSIGTLIGSIAWMNVVFISMLKFDFRDELDRLDVLRSLPIRPLAVAAAELVTPVLVLTMLQSLVFIAVIVSFRNLWPYVLLAAAYAVPFNLLLATIENLLFLMFPLRAAGVIAGDMQLVGRQMVVFFCKFMLLVVGLAIAATVGLIGYIAGHQSWPAFGVMAWVGLVGVALGAVPLLARSYSRFDPSVDTPP